MDSVQWILLGISLLSPLIHYIYRYSRYRRIARFLWRVYKASSFDATHLVAAAKALHLAENSDPNLARILKDSTAGPLPLLKLIGLVVFLLLLFLLGRSSDLFETIKSFVSG